MPRVVHFEIAAENIERANKFYAETFGWNIQKWNGPMEYWAAVSGDEKTPGINGAIMPRNNAPSNIIFTIGVASFDEAAKSIENNGGKVISPRTGIIRRYNGIFPRHRR